MKLLNITPRPETDKTFNQLRTIEAREKVKSLELITYHEGRFKTLALVRWYMSRSVTASTTYCVIRLTSYLMPIEFNNDSILAIGKDDHIGQDRIIYSFNKTIKNAGVQFENKHGIEEPEAILEAIALANYNNYDNFHFARG